MTILFSPATCSFYASEWEREYRNANNWPKDLSPVSDEVYMYYRQQAPSGKILSSQGGSPCWAEASPPTDQEKREAAEAQQKRLRAIADAEIAWRQDAEDAGIATPEESAALAEWKKFRVLLMRVDTSEPIWPEAPAS